MHAENVKTLFSGGLVKSGDRINLAGVSYFDTPAHGHIGICERDLI